MGETTGEIPRLVEEGAQNFDKIVQQKIFDAGITNEDRELLELLSKRFSVYLNSATPKEALERTVEALQLKNVIVGVLGRPNTKVENFKFVAERESAQPNEILFVGDGESDFRAAKEFGCVFVGLSNDWNTWKQEEKEFPIIHYLKEVQKYIE